MFQFFFQIPNLKNEHKTTAKLILAPGYHSWRTKMFLMSGKRCLLVDTFVYAELDEVRIMI